MATQTQTHIEVSPIKTRTVEVAIIGTRPFIMNRQSEKVKRELLLPSGRKTNADRASSLKHDPLAEYRAAPYRLPDDAPVLLGTPASAFKKGMMTAALRLPGVRKTEIAQLLWVEGDLIPIYGVPELFMSVTRSADINRTPDIRTRCIVPEWATAIRVTYATPILNESSVINLLVAAGQFSGIGDWRPEKGAGTYGQYSVTNGEKDEDFQRIIETGARAIQEENMLHPNMYDIDTAEMFDWYMTEVHARGRSGEATLSDIAA